MKLAKQLTLLALALLTFSCKKKNDDEPFSKKLSVTASYYNASGSYINNSTEATITIESGTMVNFNYNIGGEDGFGSSTVKTEVTAFDYTKETASETVTCTYVLHDNLVGAENTAIVINEDTKFTFFITSKNGEKATVGPIEVKVSNNQEIIQGDAGLVIETNDCFNCYKFASPLMNSGGMQGEYYNNINSFFNPEFVVFGAVYQGGTMYLASPSQFSSLGAYTTLMSKYSCGWNKTIVQPYTGTIDASFDYSTINYQTLDTLTISGTSEKIVATANASFVFKTAEGKKGIGKFSNNTFTDNIYFTYAYQK